MLLSSLWLKVLKVTQNSAAPMLNQVWVCWSEFAWISNVRSVRCKNTELVCPTQITCFGRDFVMAKSPQNCKYWGRVSPVGRNAGHDPAFAVRSLKFGSKLVSRHNARTSRSKFTLPNPKCLRRSRIYDQNHVLSTITSGSTNG